MRGRREASIEKVLAKEFIAAAPARGESPPNERKVKCNCKNSKCLKLYCECFRAGLLCCPDCRCSNCLNMDNNESRQQAFAHITSKNPDAFKPRIDSQPPQVATGVSHSHTIGGMVHSKGCSCKKSNCVKMYCECYQAGIQCSFNCRCEGCLNCEGGSEEDGREKGSRKRGTTEKARGVSRSGGTAARSGRVNTRYKRRGRARTERGEGLGKRRAREEGEEEIYVEEKNSKTLNRARSGRSSVLEGSGGSKTHLRQPHIRGHLFSDRIDYKSIPKFELMSTNKKGRRHVEDGRRKSSRLKQPCSKNIYF